MKRNTGPLSFLAILILLLVSCTRLPGDIGTIVLTPDNINPKQGQVVKVKVDVERLHGYNKDLTVKLDSPPAGVSAPDATIAGNVNSTEVSVTLNTSGNLNLKFKVSGESITAKDQSLALTVLPTENFELSLDKASLAQNPGTEGVVKVTVQRNATMNQPITVTVNAASLPTGVTVAPITIPANASTGDLKFVVAANAPAISNKDLTISATGQGITKTAPFKLTVILPPDFTLAFDPVSFTSLAIGQGGTGQVKVKVARNATHTDAITVSLEGLPAKVTTSTPNITIPAGQTDGTITVNAASDAATVNGATITVKAVGQAVTKTTTFALTISNVAPEILSISVSPATKTISQGGTDKVTVTVQRNSTLTGAITIAASGLQTGVTAPNVTIPAGLSSVDLNLSASQTAQIVTDQTITVTGSATGAANKSTTFKLTTQLGPGFSLGLSSSTITILKNTNDNVTVNLTRQSGFTEVVALTLEGAPAGVTGTFNPTSFTGSAASSTLNLAVATTVVAGQYSLKVKGTAGTGPGAKVVEQTLTLSVPDLTMTAANLTIVRADPATLTVNITRTAFTEAVQVTLSGLPTGVTATASTITIAAGATSGNFTLNATEDMALDPLSPTPPGNPTSGDKLTKQLSLAATATVGGKTLNATAPPVLTVKPQFELKIFKGQQAGTGTCLNNPIDTVILKQGAVGINNPTSPESDWICITLVRNGTFANKPAGQNHVFLSYQADPTIVESGQTAGSGYGFYPSEVATGNTKGNFFLKVKAGSAATPSNLPHLYYIRAYEVITPDNGSGAVVKDGLSGRKLVVTDVFLKLDVDP